jgi:hypothetical protein
LSADQLEQASELLESGQTHRNVADLLGIHRTTLTRNLATYSSIGHKEVQNSEKVCGAYSQGLNEKLPDSIFLA